MLVCAEETITGCMSLTKTHKKNATKFLKANRANKNVKHLLMNGSYLIKKGTCVYMRHLFAKFYGFETESLLMDLLDVVKLIVDIGLHDQKSNIKFTHDTAKKFICDITFLSEEAAENIVLYTLSRPAKHCVNAFGNFCVSMFDKHMNKINKKAIDVLLQGCFPMKVLMKLSKS